MLETSTEPKINLSSSPADPLGSESQSEDSLLHRKVLTGLKKVSVPGYDILVEEKDNRLDLPNEYFREKRKGAAQRKHSLCYVDAIIHTQRIPRILIEVVDNNPTSPNGITGLTVNIDRIAEIHPNIDLMFIVLAEMKSYYCAVHNAGHRLSNKKKVHCLRTSLGADPDEDSYRAMIHEGKAANFKKALIDYPISRYLRNICPPVVLFLNSPRVATEWDAYRSSALRLIQDEIACILSGKRSETRLNVQELIPEAITAPHKIIPCQPIPAPGSEATFESPNGQQRVVIKNRGRHNTRVIFPDGHTAKVPNTRLSWRLP